MSGICGLLRLNSGVADGLAAMAARLQRRGPDGTHLWDEGPVALGHTLLVTTPESLHETLPLTDPATGCTITADLRLDNRDELLTALGLARASRVIGDGELVLRAWLAWGESCLDRLLGDFAFAIWDPRTRSLFAARDQMGTRQLSFAYIPGHLFAFATEPSAVLEASGVPRDINEGRIADYLENYLEAIDFDSTFYKSVRRLPPAHCLLVNSAGLTVWRYWTLVPGSPLTLPDNKAYAEAFLEIFTEAVRCRLRSAGPVGSMLSGGMDSGSVVAVASRLLAAEGRGPLLTFSVVSPDPATCRETKAIHASLTMPGLDSYLIDISNPSPWAADLREALYDIEEPFDGSMNLPRAVYLAARRAGVRVVLDGGGGDLVLTPGLHLVELVRSGRLRELWNEAVGTERFWDGRRTRWAVLRQVALQAAVPDWLRQIRRQLRRGRDSRPAGPLLSSSFAREVDLADRVDRWRRNTSLDKLSPAHERASLISGPTEATGQERYDRVAGAMGVEPRDPFRDLRVVQFCLRCPSSQMQSDGWPKMILRRAMSGLLPEEVIWMTGKPHLGWSLTQALLGIDGPVRAMPPVTRLPTHPLLDHGTTLTAGQVLEQAIEGTVRSDYLYLALWLARERGAGTGN